MHKIFWWSAIALFLIGVFVFAYDKEVLYPRKKSGDVLLEQFKKNCDIIENSPLEKFGIYFSFSTNNLVCIYRPLAPVGRNQEIFIWDKLSFGETAGASFGQGILGKVTIDPIPILPEPDVISTQKNVVAGTSTVIETVQPAGCQESICPKARRAILRRGDRTYLIEEFDPGINLLASFKFISN